MSERPRADGWGRARSVAASEAEHVDRVAAERDAALDDLASLQRELDDARAALARKEDELVAAVVEALKRVMPWVSHAPRCAAYRNDDADEPRCTCGLGDAFAAALASPLTEDPPESVEEQR